MLERLKARWLKACRVVVLEDLDRTLRHENIPFALFGEPALEAAGLRQTENFWSLPILASDQDRPRLVGMLSAAGEACGDDRWRFDGTRVELLPVNREGSTARFLWRKHTVRSPWAAVFGVYPLTVSYLKINSVHPALLRAAATITGTTQGPPPQPGVVHRPPRPLSARGTPLIQSQD